ncbi:hypothetical protein CNQ84_07200 [Pseudomonas abyssi]|uniref:Uncharacterized protein n=1 Tax=Pseudomonas abyssi TaxID=170540 RepID=A0A2A3MJM8_9PSED|nr:hypothetical protein [Pseudomonadales bacterium]PBK04927.1 hypothetical protein CNQ84_07200 [Pseudomonas abyssi]
MSEGAEPPSFVAHLAGHPDKSSNAANPKGRAAGCPLARRRRRKADGTKAQRMTKRAFEFTSNDRTSYHSTVPPIRNAAHFSQPPIFC